MVETGSWRQGRGDKVVETEWWRQGGGDEVVEAGGQYLNDLP